MRYLISNKDTHMARVILSLALPTMLEQLMQTAVQYIDTVMVGSLGTAATAAVGATTTVNWLIGSSIAALAVGFLSYIARALGAADEERAHRAAAQAVTTVLIVGTLFTVLTLALSKKIPIWMNVQESLRHDASVYFFILYSPMLFRTASIIFGTVLRASGDTATPMKISILVNILNVMLNYLLIYPSRWLFNGTFYMPGAGMGVAGAALASAVSVAVGGIIITIVLWRHPVVSPAGRKLQPDMQILRPCMRVAFPNMLQRFGTSLGYVAFASMINSLGEIPTAAHTVANTVESLFYIPGFGMQTAAATLAGNALGANDKSGMNRLSRIFIPIELILMLFSGAALFISAPLLISMFTESSAVISLGSTVLRMVALSEPFYGFSIIVEGFMQGVGKTREPFIFNIIGMWLIRIGCTYICINLLGMGLVSAWACMITHNLFLFVIFLYYHLSGKWSPLYEKRCD